LVASGIAWSNVNLSRSDDITYDGHLMRISPDLSLFDPVFLSKLMRVEAVRKQFIARGKTGTMTTIGQKDIASVTFQIPSLPEQTKIANFLTALDRKTESVSSQISHTQAFKKGLLQQMFV
jgi:type I restriction enzyme, S subunit